MPEISELMKNLGNASVEFGLVAQGHMPTIRAMLSEGKPWETIAAKIGWERWTAEACYLREVVAERDTELARQKELAFLCQDEVLNNCGKYLRDHPETDLVESHATTTDGDELTVVVLRGHQNHTEPLRSAKAELAKLREALAFANKKAKEIEGQLCYELPGVSLPLSAAMAAGMAKELIVGTGKSMKGGDEA